MIRLLETLLHPGGFVHDWTSRELHTRVVARRRLTGDQYRLSQLRYDLSKLRAKGLVERIGKSRRYCLTPIGLNLASCSSSSGRVTSAHSPVLSSSRIPKRRAAFNSVVAAYREIDTALDHLSAALGLQPAA